MKTKHITVQEWREHRNLLTGSASAMLAAVAGEIPGLLQAIQTLARSLPAEDCSPYRAKQWIKLYRDHRRILSLVSSIFPAKLDLSGIADGFRAFCKLSPDDRRASLEAMTSSEFAEHMGAAQQFAKEFSATMMAGAAGNFMGSPEAEANAKEIVFSVEMQFFLRVVFPYLAVHGEFPTRDYAKARRGDLIALERVLVIDKMAITDPMIATHFRAAASLEDRTRIEFLAKALASEPPKITPKTAKLAIGGIISSFFRQIGQNITAPEIRNLFDAVARQQGKGLVDPDISEAPEAFSKAVQRNRGRWKW